MKVACLGSLKLDVVTQLADAFPYTADTYDVADVYLRLGGTAGVFAAAARGHFESLDIIAAVGSDQWTSMIMSGIVDMGAVLHPFWCASPNGVVLSVRAAAAADGATRRMLIASAASPHKLLTERHVQDCKTVIAEADVLVCDTYLIQARSSGAALLAALSIAKLVGTRTVLDVVPHNLFRELTLVDLEPYFAAADVVVIEARTLSGLAGIDGAQAGDDDHAVDTALHIAETIDLGCSWTIRSGRSNIEMVTVKHPNGHAFQYCTTYRSERDLHGFGDRLLVSELLNGVLFLND